MPGRATLPATSTTIGTPDAATDGDVDGDVDADVRPAAAARPQPDALEPDWPAGPSDEAGVAGRRRPAR